ncbi:MAG: phage tail tape measure protein [Xanthobacteraceae bacterium]
MAKEFSVYVNIGGKLNPSLASAVTGAKTQVRSLETVFATAAARINAPFVAAQKHFDAFSKRMQKVQRAGRNLTMGVTMPTGFAAATMFRGAVERDKAENNLEALGGISSGERREVSAYADSIAAKYGRATGILKTFNEMLKAGFSVPAAKGSIASILEGSIVADGEMTAADLAGSVSKIVTQYGLGMKTVEDAAASSRRITDNLIYGANSTAATVKDMTEAYKFVGAAASAAGESIESTNALIIGLSKAGQMGSEAGVALRSAYVRLLKPTNAGRATMARLGLDYGDFVSGGKRTGAGVASGLGAYGYNVPASDLDKALARNKGSADKQRKAVFDAVVAHLGADQAKDIEAIGKAVDGALTLSGSKVDLTGLMGALKKAGATQGDLANIFEGRQSVRMLSLLKADLENILKDVNEGAAGYSEKTVAKRQQGLEGATRRLDAAWQTFSNTLVKAVTPEILGMMERLGGAVKNLSASSPGMLRLGVGLAAAAAAAGPLLFVLGAVGRVGMIALRGVNLALLGLLMPARLLATLLKGLVVGGLARIGAMALGLRMLSTFGAAATLSAVAASLGRLALAPFMLIGAGLRGIGAAMWFIVANPVGLILTTLVAALTALGVWVYNNWNGIKEFFGAFGKGFMEGLGPAAGTVSKMADALGSVVGWLGNLLGPIDESGAKWRSWGEAVGGVAAKGVNAVIDGIQRLIGFMSTVIEKASQVGSAIANMWRGGGGGVAAGAAKSPFVQNSVSGARALGGPVLSGKTYLVGERGPELFTPGLSGNIHTNDTLRKLTADGAAAVAGSTTNTTTRGPVTITNNWTINGADNPAAVERQIDSRFGELLRQLEFEQQGLLND